MDLFKKVNNITGWLVFFISAAVYLITLEPTASFWDCGEFIISAYKLEVGHPPGAPVFMLVGRLFTIFAGPENAGYMMNVLSGLLSAFTILFLFWTITYLARRMAGDPTDYTPAKWISVMGSGVIGALAYTFSDTFWFSAVEAEVYAFSSFLTAIVVWIMLKWENAADEPYSGRWLVLIAFIMGLSIGVHLLNLLTIPVLGLIYYYRKYKPSTKGLIITAIVSFVMLGGLVWVIIPGIFSVAAKFELLFVNGMGLPYNTGEITWFALLVAGLVWGIFYAYRKQKVLLNTALLCMTVLVIGYSSYAIIVIRSYANPPMDQNDPQDPFSLLYYLNREQYGEMHLVKGPYYNAPLVSYKDGKKMYAKQNGKYEVIYVSPKYEYDSRFVTIFPRMYDSSNPNKIAEYKNWGNVKGVPIKMSDYEGNMQIIYKPTFAENLRYFMAYQVDWMYMRYFMWNFAGRQNDLQGYGDPLRGNWISGIKFLDEIRLGPQDNLPAFMANNKGRNTYFFLPLLLGLVGLFYHYSKHKPDFYMVMMLFLMTGLAIIVYLNQPPLQPRERDYAYAGSFYAFAVWIGLGVMAIIESLPDRRKSTYAAGSIAFIALLAVPGRMATQNWDDHDRSGRSFCPDFGANYLESCAPNAIIFTNGDNDTFPLWYAQEVEGVRTDVRVINMSYFSADWYIDQSRRQAYNSPPVKYSLKPEQYQSGVRESLDVIPITTDYEELKSVMRFVANESQDKTSMIKNLTGGYTSDLFPARNLKITVDSLQVMSTKTLSPKDAGLMVDTMKWRLDEKNQAYYGGKLLTKNGIMFLDLLAQNNWERPVYFATTVPDEHYLNIQDYFQQEGLTYRIVPIKTPMDTLTHDLGRVNTDVMYENLMNKFKWGGLESGKDIYIDENISSLMVGSRKHFARLAGALIAEGDNERARKVLDRGMELFPNNKAPYEYLVTLYVEYYLELGDIEKANKLARDMAVVCMEKIDFLERFTGQLAQALRRDMQFTAYTMYGLLEISEKYQQKELYLELAGMFGLSE